MLEIILQLVVCFVMIIFFLPFAALFFFALIRILTPKYCKRNQAYQMEDYKKTVLSHDGERRTEKEGQEDSEGDMLMTADDENDILFPPEFDDEQ